jgi:CheY-like chemotaxis protein
MAAAAAPQVLEVLVVDDDADTLGATQLLLQMPGVAVKTACGGMAAIEQVRTACPDVVLLDIGMPQVGGYEVAEAIHQAHCANEPVLVALTGYSEPASKRRCAELGFDLHLTKPIDFDVVRELLMTLNQVERVRSKHGLAVERHRMARAALIQAQIDMAGTLLDVAATTRTLETRQRCLAKAQKAYLAIARELRQDNEPAELPAGFSDLEERLRRGCA